MERLKIEMQQQCNREREYNGESTTCATENGERENRAFERLQNIYFPGKRRLAELNIIKRKREKGNLSKVTAMEKGNQLYLQLRKKERKRELEHLEMK